MNKITIVLLSASFALSLQWSTAATLPSGTSLSVRTDETISSNEAVGATFAAHLQHGVVVGGKLLLPAGTKVTGRVDSSRRLSQTHLVLNVIQIANHGRMVPIKTAGGVKADDNRFKTRGGIAVGSGGFYQLTAGTRLQFRLAQPVNLGEPAPGHR